MISITSPRNDSNNWFKWRLCLEGGRRFRDRYLHMFSNREAQQDFENRKAITPTEPHAKHAIYELRDMIAQHLHEVLRTGSTGYMAFTKNADCQGNSLNAILSKTLIVELMAMGRMCVIVDRDDSAITTKADELANMPYICCIPIENVQSRKYDRNGRLIKLLVTRSVMTYDAVFQLETGIEERQYLYEVNPGGWIDVTINPTIDLQPNQNTKKFKLDLDEIPFVEAVLSDSLMRDIAEYQIALLNIVSCDTYFACTANFPFYVEQRKGGGIPVVDPTTGKEAEIEDTTAGPSYGRYYGQEKPGFINPSPEPLKVSMELRSDLRVQIRQILQLTLNRVKPTRASGESKSADMSEKETGISAIAIELECFETKLQDVINDFLGDDDQGTVEYPDAYKSPSIDDLDTEVKLLIDTAKTTTNKDLRKQCLIRVGELLFGIGSDVVEKLKASTEEVPFIEPADIATYKEAGIIDNITSTVLAGFTEEVANKAQADHVERLKAIAIAQSQGAAASQGIVKDTMTAKNGKKMDKMNGQMEPQP